MNGLHVRTRMLKIYDIHFLRTLMYVCIFSTHKSSKNEKISFSLLAKKQKVKTQNTADEREKKRRRHKKHKNTFSCLLLLSSTQSM